ncbi:NlpC/P60 family protein [Altererythrobacter aquiaggeris]|uniref:NlpC/P60 family protein n=1 Tax=Aestuarierythrobacter aquiaggeris TaxID=1898396 RepID=UPI003018F3C9
MTGDTGRAIARAAYGLVGSPFRLHGRDPATGIDCAGLVLVALERGAGIRIELAGYGLRNSSIDACVHSAGFPGLTFAQGPPQAGDIVLVKPGPAQWHLLVASGNGGFIHAHAGLRKVVRVQGPLPWRTQMQWRIIT